MAKQRINLNLEDDQCKQLAEVKHQTGESMSNIVRLLLRYLPEIKQELIEEAKRRLDNG